MSSGGGSSSDSGSTGGYDEAGISTPTSAYESIGSTGGYDEAGTTTPSYAGSINTILDQLMTKQV
jgi:hypothetical protein